LSGGGGRDPVVGEVDGDGRHRLSGDLSGQIDFGIGSGAWSPGRLAFWGSGAGEGVGRGHPAEELRDVLVFLPALGERGAGEQGIAPGTDLGGDMPPGQLAQRSP